MGLMCKGLKYRVRPDLATKVVPSFPCMQYSDWEVWLIEKYHDLVEVG